MANIPQNDQYQSTGSTPIVPKTFKYTPSTTYRNLAQLKEQGQPFAAAPTPIEGTFQAEEAKNAAISQYGNLVNGGQGIPTQQSFMPIPQDQFKNPIPIPADYGTFMQPADIQNKSGEKLSWGTPTAPVIRNISGDANGQYVQDTSNPDLLVKTNRGSMPFVDRAIHDGRPGFMYQIDHIMPLELGGADTLANRQLLTSDQNDLKTKAQAIPYTLYAHGDISLSEARVMAMQWKDRDLTDVPEPNGVGLVSDTPGKTGIDIARETAKRWTQPKPVTVKDVIAGIPEAAKDFGKGWLPDSVREFVKGFGTGATLGFLPYEQGDNESSGAWWAGKLGMVAGGVASFVLGGELIDGALALGGLARGALGAYRGVAAAEATAAGFEGAADVAAVANGAENGSQIAATTFKSLNKAPGYLSKLLTPDALARAAKFGATNVLVGQGQQAVSHHLNPYTLSGQAPQTDQSGVIGNMFSDLAVGALSGIGSPTIKGTAYAMALPMTLSYIANPDNPTDALTNGVIFGAMHAAGTFRAPGYMNIEALGGKPYESPVIKSFENTANRAAYASLSYYAPEIYPAIQPGAMVPDAAHIPETVQAAKDAAIKNVWTRFFFGKDATPEVQNKTLSDFQNFSENLNQSIDQSQPTPKKFTFSMADRRANTAADKTKVANLRDAFGKDYQTRNAVPDSMTGLPDEGMDLQTALTEVKRVTASARQLFKGGLTGDLRNQADVNDLLSFSKSNLQNRFDSLQDYANPPVAKQVVNTIDDTFMRNSFNNSEMNRESALPNGDAALTGAALTINKPAADYFFAQRSAGNASPNILLIDRSDTAPLWRMKNSLLDKNDIIAKNYAPDPNPENALQAFGVVKNPQTGAKELVPLGWVASDFRLNTATGKGHEAFNQHPAVKKFADTNGQEGFKPIDLHKDQIAPVMRSQGLTVLVANLDPRATGSTIQSNNPFIPININDQNWRYSQTLASRLSQQPDVNPVSMSIANVSHAINAKAKTDAITQMRQKIQSPASSAIPTSVTPVTPHDNVVLPREETRSLLQTVEKSLDVAGPKQVKQSFQKNLGIVLTDEQANKVFTQKDSLTMRDGVKILVDAVNQGNASSATQMKLQFAKTYLESGVLQASDAGKALPDMLLLGRMKNNAVRAVEDTALPPELSKPLDVNNYRVNTQEPVTQPTDTQQPSTPSSVTPAAVSDNPLANSIVSAAGLGSPKDVQILPPKLDPAMEATRAIGEEEARQNQSADEGQPHYSSKDVLTPQEFAQNEWQKLNRGQVPEKGPERWNLVQQIATNMEKAFPSMELEQAVGFTAKSLPELSGFSKDYVKPPLGKPGSLPGEYGKFIQNGLKTNPLERPQAHYFAKAFDKGLQDMLGKDYKKIPRLSGVLDDYFKDVASREFNYAGKEITQPSDVLKYRATGERDKEMAAYGKRNEQNAANPAEQGGSLSDTDLAHLGIQPGEEDQGFFGMNVRPEHQDQNMVHDLTAFENLVGGLFSPDAKQTGAAAVEAVKDLFMGDKNVMGLRQYILTRIPAAKRSVSLDSLIKEAKTNDVKAEVAQKDSAEKVKTAEEVLPKLKKQLETITKAVHDPLERSSWQTPEILDEDLKDVMAKIQKYSKIIEETKDGSGGPGIHDGKGGAGDWLSGIGNAIGGAATGIWNGLTNALSNTTTYTRPPDTATSTPSTGGATRDYSAYQPVTLPVPAVPAEFGDAMKEYSNHTTVPLDTAARQFTAENGGVWSPTLRGHVDKNDFGVTQLNPQGVAVITGKSFPGAQNYFKQIYGHEFNSKSGHDQILASGVLMNHLKQFDLPQYGIDKPTTADVLMSYNMGAKNYAMSFGVIPFEPSPNYPTMEDLVKHRDIYAKALTRRGINLNDLAKAN